MGKAKTKRKGAFETTPGSKKSKKSVRGSTTLGSSEPTVLNDDSTFGQLVKKAGFVLMAGNSPNQLNVDQAMFQQRLAKALKRSSDLEQVVEDFINGIQNHTEDPVRFKYSLLPTSTSAECESARGGNQDSLMRLLLGIDELQSPVINVLLEKLPEFMDDQDSMFDRSDAANLPRLILSQFQWLDRVLNSEEMTNKMLEMVGVSSLAVQQEIIACIPEVVSDNEHNAVATKLQELLFNSSELTVPVLDALSNLNLTPDLMTEVRNAALQTLISADLQDLPVIVKFILQSVTNTDAVEVISQVRTNLEFPTNLPSDSSFTPHRKKGSGSKNNDNTLLILDAIKTNMRFQKVVTEGWVKAIENVHTSSEHKVIDIFILLIAHAVTANRKKAVESLFRSKVRSGNFREELLEAAFSTHAQVIREYFPSILSLAEVLLRSPEPAVSLFACCIYRQAFLAFDMYCKQEVIGSLVAHIGSGFQGEIEAGLDVLLSLVEHHASDVAPFAIFIKGVLDYIGNLSLPQIRKLFSVLCVLAFRNTQERANIQDELHIVIRKQLSSNSAKYKRIGVIGALMIVRNMAFRQRPGQGKELSEESYMTIVSLVKQVRSSSNPMPEASALFFDELANIMEQRQLDPRVEEFIANSIQDDFQDDFVVDVEADQVSGDYGLPMSEVYGLEAEESQGGVAINLLPLVSRAERAQLNLGSSLSNEESETDRARTVSPLCMTPHFRLLRMCEAAQNENLEGIDALLGCPLYNVSDGVMSKMSSLAKHEREMLCTCLILTINWFREVVNAFSGLTDAEMRGKVLARLKNITEVQKHLQTCLAETPNFNPPLANFDNELVPSSDGASTSTSGPTNTATVSSKRGRKPKETKKNAANTSGILNDTVAHSSTQDTTLDTTQNRSTDTEVGGTESGAIDLSRYRAYFRELDIDVFNILGCGLVTKSVLDSEMHTKEVVVLKLQPPELHFLLEDLSLKLDHALASSSKRRTFLKTKSDKNTGFSHLNRLTPREIAVKAIKLLPHLCDHLESTSAFFQALIAQNDGVLDGPGSYTPEYNEMAACLYLLLKSLLSLFSWNGFASSENKSLFMDALKVLTSRIKSSSRTQLTAKQLHKHAFSYLEKFLDTVPDLSSAICLLRLLVSLSGLSETTDNNESIADIAKGLLKREWLTQDGLREKGAKHNEQLQSLLRIFLCHTPDVLKSIQDICTVGIQELLESNERTGYSTTYPTLNRLSFGSYYRIMSEHLITYLRDLYARGASNRGGHMTQQRLIRWNMAVRVFHILISLIKEFDQRSNLTSALKNGRVFIELFLKHGMPLLDQFFPSQRDDVLGLLKTLQQSTRSLHHMCSHSKVAKDVSLTKHVPAVKRNLELFVYRVKAMLVLHKCQEAFWLGNLKNRDLHGEEILTQQTNDSVSEDGDEKNEDTELPSEDSSSGDESATTMGQEEKSDSDDESYSESF